MWTTRHHKNGSGIAVDCIMSWRQLRLQAWCVTWPRKYLCPSCNTSRCTSRPGCHIRSSSGAIWQGSSRISRPFAHSSSYIPTLDLSMASSSCTFGGLMLRHALAALISDHKGAHVSWAAAPNNLPASLCVIIITCPAPPSTLCTRQHESQCFLCRFAGQ